jgi:hypothetical protein
MQRPSIDELLSDIGEIRGALQAPALFPPDHPVRTRLIEQMPAARATLSNRWSALVWLTARDFRMSPQAFSDAAVNLMLIGFRRKSLGMLLDRPVFRELVEAHGIYLYQFISPLDVVDAQELDGDSLLGHFVIDILEALADDAHYASLEEFDGSVFVKIAAFISAVDAGGGRFGPGPEGGEESTAPVPRQPIPPQLIGEEEAEIPVEGTPSEFGSSFPGPFSHRLPDQAPLERRER